MKVTFKKGLPGLDEYKDYEIQEIEGGEEFKLLQCNEKKELGLVIISPFQVEKEYEIKITDEIIKNLSITSPEDVLVYSTVTLNSDPKKITANLRAPILINVHTGLAEQLITENEKYKIKDPIFKG